MRLACSCTSFQLLLATVALLAAASPRAAKHGGNTQQLLLTNGLHCLGHYHYCLALWFNLVSRLIPSFQSCTFDKREGLGTQSHVHDATILCHSVEH